MAYLIDDIVKALKNARAAKNLSQRDVSQLTAMPQSYISRIEAGTVDIGLSNLIALARALDLEVRLVPKTTIPAVDSILRSTQSPEPWLNLFSRELTSLVANSVTKTSPKETTDHLAKINAERDMLTKALTRPPDKNSRGILDLNEDPDE